MPDNPMEKDDQGQRRESPGQTPMPKPDKSREGSDKDRKASDEDMQKKQVPGMPDPENPNR